MVARRGCGEPVRARVADVRQRVPWGLGMGWRTFVTARTMEHWAHGLDIRAAVHVAAVDTDRLQHIAWLGYSTLPYAFGARRRRSPRSAHAPRRGPRPCRRRVGIRNDRRNRHDQRSCRNLVPACGPEDSARSSPTARHERPTRRTRGDPCSGVSVTHRGQRLVGRRADQLFDS